MRCKTVDIADEITTVVNEGQPVQIHCSEIPQLREIFIACFLIGIDLPVLKIDKGVFNIGQSNHGNIACQAGIAVGNSQLFAYQAVYGARYFTIYGKHCRVLQEQSKRRPCNPPWRF